MIGVDNAKIVNGDVRALGWSRTTSNQYVRSSDADPFAFALDFECMSIRELRAPLIDRNPIASQLGSNNLSLSLDNTAYTGGNVPNGNTTALSFCSKTSSLENGLTYGLAGDRPCVSAHAADHAGPINDGDALSLLRRRNGSLLACRATANHDEVIVRVDGVHVGSSPGTTAPASFTVLAEAAASEDDLASEPTGFVGGEKGRDQSDVLWHAGSTEWSQRLHRGCDLVKSVHGTRALGIGYARVDGVNADLLRSKFLREHT